MTRPSHPVGPPDALRVDVADLPAGTPLEPEPDGTPRHVCACGLPRARHVLGRSRWRVVWSGVLVPLVGAALIALALAGAALADPPAVRLTCAGLVLLLLAGSIAGGRAGGHRGWCAARTSAYWFLAFPAVLLGALSAF